MLKHFTNNSYFKKGFITIIQRGIGVILSFGIMLFITNFFSDTEVGKYQFFSSVLVVMGTLALLGLNVSFIQQVGKIKANHQEAFIPKLYYHYVIILLIMSVLLALLYFLTEIFIQHLINEINQQIFRQIAMIIFPYCLAVLNFQVLVALGKLYLSEFFRNVLKFLLIFSAFVVIYFLNYHQHLIHAFMMASVASAIISTYFVIVVLRRKYADIKIEGTQPFSVKRILRISVPMTLSFLSLLMMQNMDLLMLKAYQPFSVLAYYGIAIKISMMLSIVMSAVNTSIAPQVAEFFYKKDKKALRETIEKGLLLNNLLSLPMIILVLLLPETILRFFGEEYTQASTALVILTVGQMVNAFSGSTDLYLNMTGKQNYFQKIILIALALNIVLNLWLIPIYGMNGAAIATACSLIFWNVVSIIYIKKKDDIWVIINFNLIKKLYAKFK